MPWESQTSNNIDSHHNSELFWKKSAISLKKCDRIPWQFSDYKQGRYKNEVSDLFWWKTEEMAGNWRLMINSRGTWLQSSVWRAAIGYPERFIPHTVINWKPTFFCIKISKISQQRKTADRQQVIEGSSLFHPTFNTVVPNWFFTADFLLILVFL